MEFPHVLNNFNLLQCELMVAVGYLGLLGSYASSCLLPVDVADQRTSSPGLMLWLVVLSSHDGTCGGRRSLLLFRSDVSSALGCYAILYYFVRCETGMYQSMMYRHSSPDMVATSDVGWMASSALFLVAGWLSCLFSFINILPSCFSLCSYVFFF